MSERRAKGGTLILGGGFAGAWVARLLGKRGLESTIVNRENFMLFASLLPEAASGSLEPRHVVVPPYDGLSTSLIANGGRALESKSWQRIFANCAHKPGGPKYRLGQ